MWGWVLKIVCKGCGVYYDIPDERLAAFGKDFLLPCSRCGHKIRVEFKPQGEMLLDLIMRDVTNLPPMPQVVRQARLIIQDPSKNYTDLARVIETDPAVVVNLLRLANSPYYGLSGRVSSIEHASAVLGVDVIMELLAASCSADLLGDIMPGYGYRSGLLWRHCLAVAFCSQSIAEKHYPELAEDAYAAGLIHDAGKLVMDKYLRDRRDQLEELLQDGEMSMLESERLLLGLDHAELAAMICERWLIPDAMAMAISYHHNPLASVGNNMANIIYLADQIALSIGLRSRFIKQREFIDYDMATLLDFTKDELQDLALRAQDYVERLATKA